MTMNLHQQMVFAIRAHLDFVRQHFNNPAQAGAVSAALQEADAIMGRLALEGACNCVGPIGADGSPDHDPGCPLAPVPDPSKCGLCGATITHAGLNCSDGCPGNVGARWLGGARS